MKLSLKVPVVSGNIRTTGRDLILQGHLVPKDTDVYMNYDVIQGDDRYFADPDAFTPERWIRNSGTPSSFHPFASAPFGFGSRNCIGKRLAHLELETLILRMVRNFRLTMASSRTSV
ncbi:Cytochrome P450 [Sergentomyia squamirostris]